MVGFINNKNNNEVNVLLMVYAMATCKEGSLLNEIATSFNNPKKGNMITTPIKLKKEPHHATNFEMDENFKLTIKAVDVVPMLAPITIGIAISISIVP